MCDFDQNDFDHTKLEKRPETESKLTEDWDGSKQKVIIMIA